MQKIDLGRIVNEINRLKGLNPAYRERILERADRELSPETAEETEEWVMDLSYDRPFCEAARIDYANMTSNTTRLIRTAIVAEYLLN
jgi:hypothetical protein